MEVLLIVAHPNKQSFNFAIAHQVKETLSKWGYKVLFHDLYGEKFNPVLKTEEIPETGKIDPVIKKYCEELKSVDGIIIIHPNWWGQPPAILKGWIDRVLRPGIAYEFLEGDSGEGIPNGLLKRKTAIVFNTSNTSTEREKNVFGDPLENIWKNCIFELCGVETYYRKMFNIVVTSSQTDRAKWLYEVGQILRRYFK